MRGKLSNVLKTEDTVLNRKMPGLSVDCRLYRQVARSKIITELLLKRTMKEKVSFWRAYTERTCLSL